MRILFDSKKIEHKRPFGCIRELERCHLSVHVPDCCACESIALSLFSENGFALTVPMAPEGRVAPYTYYGADFTLCTAGLYFYSFKIKTKTSAFTLYKRGDDTNMEAGDLWQISCLPADFHTPEHFKCAIDTQIFPDRFYKDAVVGKESKATPFVLHEREDDTPVYLPDEKGIIQNCDFFGGNLKGITKKLPYLASLSVTAIYLNPIFEAYSNHRYDTANYKRIDPLLGTEEDFRTLCKEAHRLGIRVVLDGVFSHTGSESRYFDKADRYGDGAFHHEDSPYHAWYQFSEDGKSYTSWWGIDTLPATHELCPSYLDYIIRNEDSVVAHWLRAGADGFRLDVADELPDAFIDLLRRRVKEVKPDAVVIGEVWEDASNKISYSERRRYFTGAELDAVMNYPFRDAIIAFLRGDAPAAALTSTVMTVCENYPREVVPCLMNSLSTHDTARILTLLSTVPTPSTRDARAAYRLSDEDKALALERLLAAVFLQFTLPGSPCIYYGDEAEMEGYEDPFNRRFYPWGKENADLLAFHREIAALRAQSKTLRLGDTRVRALGEDALLIRREWEGEVLFCAVTRGESVSLEGVKEVLFSRGFKEGVLSRYGFIIYKE